MIRLVLALVAALVVAAGVPGCGCDPIELPGCWSGPGAMCKTIGEQCEDCGPLGCSEFPA